MTKDKLDNAAVMKLLHCRKLNNFSTKSKWTSDTVGDYYQNK